MSDYLEEGQEEQTFTSLVNYGVKMSRSIGIERVFSLGNYNMFRVSDTITDIPDELAFDSQFISDLRGLQLLEVEKLNIKYSQLRDKLNYDDESVLEAINASITRKLESILEKYNQIKGE